MVGVVHSISAGNLFQRGAGASVFQKSTELPPRSDSRIRCGEPGIDREECDDSDEDSLCAAAGGRLFGKGYPKKQLSVFYWGAYRASGRKGERALYFSGAPGGCDQGSSGGSRLSPLYRTGGEKAFEPGGTGG